MKGKSRHLFIGLIILTLLLAACAPAGGEQGAGTPGAGEPGVGDPTPGDLGMPETGETVAPGEGTGAGLPAECTDVQLQYWNPFTGPDGPLMGQLVEEFNTANPGVTVTMNTIPGGEYVTQLGTAVASGTQPDVLIVWADHVATLAFRNIIRPIDDLVGQMEVEAGNFPEAVWTAGEVAGSRYAIPLDIHPLVMFYNADLLNEAGIEAPPTDRESFEAAAEAITGDGTYGFMITQGFPVMQIFQTLLHQFGGTEFNADGTEATWNSPEGVQALEWMRDAQSRFSEPNLEVDAELNAFKAGGVGMIWNGIWQTTNVTGEGVAFNGMGTAIPQIGDQMAVWAGSHQLGLTVQQTPDACKDAASAAFIQYLLDNSVTWAQAGQIPANTTVRESEEFMAIEPQASIAPSAENAFFPPSVPGITDALVPLGEAVGSVMSGQVTDIQAALDDSAARSNEILQQNRDTYGESP